MNTIIRPTVAKRSRFKPLSALAVGTAGALAMGASVHAQSTPTESGLPAAKVDCEEVTHNGEDYWDCFVSSSGVVEVADLPGDVSAEPVIITAAGAPGYSQQSKGTTRSGGAGGGARTVVEGGDLGSEFFVYTRGPKGSNLSGRGGSATVMSEVPIEDVKRTGEVYVVAAGGGAQGTDGWGGFSQWCGYGSGGAGGVADAALTADELLADPKSANGRGGLPGDGMHNNCNDRGNHGQQPTPGDRGAGGIQLGDRRSDGGHGIGGVGGYGDDWWRDGDDNKVAVGHSAGAGGHSTVWANGGGGWGGGAAGERHYGGAGGGSFAAAPTAAPDDSSLIADELKTAGNVGVQLLYRA